MARYIHYAILLLLVISSCSAVATFTPTPPLYKTRVISPQANAVFQAGEQITVKVQHLAPQGMGYCYTNQSCCRVCERFRFAFLAILNTNSKVFFICNK